MAAALKKFTRKEIESHNKKNNVLFVIDNMVYDVTDYLEEHPGGSEVLVEHAGKDATADFEDVGHSSDAKELMVKYRVVEVVDEDKVKVWRRAVSWDGSKDGESGLRSRCGKWLLPVALGVLVVVLFKYLRPALRR